MIVLFSGESIVASSQNRERDKGSSERLHAIADSNLEDASRRSVSQSILDSKQSSKRGMSDVYNQEDDFESSQTHVADPESVGQNHKQNKGQVATEEALQNRKLVDRQENLDQDNGNKEDLSRQDEAECQAAKQMPEAMITAHQSMLQVCLRY